MLAMRLRAFAVLDDVDRLLVVTWVTRARNVYDSRCGDADEASRHARGENVTRMYAATPGIQGVAAAVPGAPCSSASRASSWA